MAGPVQGELVVAVFASDRGPGDPERATLMGEAGRMLARHGARILCLAENGVVPVPLITAARAAGGSVEVLADDSIVLPPALASVPIAVVSAKPDRYRALGDRAQVLLVLPGSLASIQALFETWAQPREAHAGLPVVMLNRHRAFEVVRGFASDVMAASLSGYDRHIQFADTVDDLWNKIAWIREQRR